MSTLHRYRRWTTAILVIAGSCFVVGVSYWYISSLRSPDTFVDEMSDDEESNEIIEPLSYNAPTTNKEEKSDADNDGTIEDIQISIKKLESDKFSIRISPSATVLSLKSIIFDTQSIEPELQRLIYRAQELKDDFAVSHYGIQNGSTLHLVIRRNIIPNQVKGRTVTPNNTVVNLHNVPTNTEEKSNEIESLTDNNAIESVTEQKQETSDETVSPINNSTSTLTNVPNESSSFLIVSGDKNGNGNVQKENESSSLLSSESYVNIEKEVINDSAAIDKQTNTVNEQSIEVNNDADIDHKSEDQLMQNEVNAEAKSKEEIVDSVKEEKYENVQQKQELEVANNKLNQKSEKTMDENESKDTSESKTESVEDSAPVLVEYIEPDQVSDDGMEMKDDTIKPKELNKDNMFEYKNGKLKIRLLKATNMEDEDFGFDETDFSDCFVKLELPKNKWQQSTIVKDSENPKWNEEFIFNVFDPLNDVLSMTVEDHDTTVNDEIGKVEIKVSEVINATDARIVNQQFDVVGSKYGWLYLDLQYYEESEATI